MGEAPAGEAGEGGGERATGEEGREGEGQAVKEGVVGEEGSEGAMEPDGKKETVGDVGRERGTTLCLAGTLTEMRCGSRAI